MDSLNEAKRFKELAESAAKWESEKALAAVAAAYAAIAQADQLTRIADMLEGYLATHDNPTLLAVRAARREPSGRANVDE